MALDDAADLAVFYDTEEFAVAATYNGAAVTVIFDDATGRVSAPGADVTVAQLKIHVRRSEVAAPAAEDTVVIAGITYKVRDIARDISGANWELTLRKTS